MTAAYKIVCYYRRFGRRRILRRGLSLAEAQAWCSRSDTTDQSGYRLWFHGFEKEGVK